MKKSLFAPITLLSACILLCACAVTVYVVDPYAHYHPVALPLTDNPGYAASGIARNYEYDTVLLGSSMVENTPVSQMDAHLGGQSVKIPMRGGTASDHARVLELCFDTHNIRHVVYCMDPTSFAAPPGEAAHEFPEYLWNGVGIDDISYLLNSGILLDKVRDVRRNERLLQWYATDRDAMYTWTDVVFSRENALSSYAWSASKYEMKPADYFADRFRRNFEDCVERFVAAHPDTKFTFYFPPYSVIYWILQSDAGNLDTQLWMREQFARALLSYSNVTIHDFAGYTPWILDLNRYMDYSHHDMQMNAQIIEAIANQTHRVTSAEDVITANDIIRQAVSEFVRPQ